MRHADFRIGAAGCTENPPHQPFKRRRTEATLTPNLRVAT